MQLTSRCTHEVSACFVIMRMPVADGAIFDLGKKNIMPQYVLTHSVYWAQYDVASSKQAATAIHSSVAGIIHGLMLRCTHQRSCPQLPSSRSVVPFTRGSQTSSIHHQPYRFWKQLTNCARRKSSCISCTVVAVEQRNPSTSSMDENQMWRQRW